MRKPEKSWIIQIEVTNDCHHRCSYCSRAINYYSNPYYISLVQLEKALQSLTNWKNAIGCYGGEPTLHPQFPEICQLFQKYVPQKRSAIFSSRGKYYTQYQELVEKTFGIINLNDHDHISHHHPILLATKDSHYSPRKQKLLINNCWIQHLWGVGINNKGGFFCEIAAALDQVLNGPGGVELVADWWKNNDIAFMEQRKRYCPQCGVPLPLKKIPANSKPEYLSPSNAKILKSIPSRLLDHTQIANDLSSFKKKKAIFSPERYWKRSKHVFFRAPIKFQIKIFLAKIFRIKYLIINRCRYLLRNDL